MAGIEDIARVGVGVSPVGARVCWREDRSAGSGAGGGGEGERGRVGAGSVVVGGRVDGVMAGDGGRGVG